jgi:hypothetical protein
VLKPRRAFTLVELCIALTLGALALSIVVAIGTRERRLHVALAHRVAGGRQLRHAAQILPIDLRALDPRGGDISPGEARDTSIQFRSTVAAGVICSISATEIALVPAAAREGELYSELSAPRAGDTLWSLADADTSDRWIPAAIQSVRQTVGRCAAPASNQFVGAGDAASPSTTLTLSRDCASLGIRVGAPVRISRLARYSIYRASDGGWYLGYRDAAAGGGFDVIQPVSGPYTSRSSVRFRYLASNGAELASPVDSTRDVSAVAVTLVATVGDLRGVSAAVRRPAPVTDSLAILIALRNAP